MGLQEFISTSLIHPDQAAAVSLPAISTNAFVRMLNPGSVDHSVLRPSLIPSLLLAVKKNQHHGAKDIAAFEIGRTYLQEGDQYLEKSAIGIVLSGQLPPLQWAEKSRTVDFYDLKGKIEQLLTALGVSEVEFRPSSIYSFHPGRQAMLFADKIELGVVAEAHPALLRRFDVAGPVLLTEIYLQLLLGQKRAELSAKEPPPYPGSERDWTITLREQTPVQDVLTAVKSTPSRLLKKVHLIDIYRSSSIGEGWKNLTIRFVYRDDTKTLSDQAVEAEHSRLMDGVLKRLGEQVRT